MISVDLFFEGNASRHPKLSINVVSPSKRREEFLILEPSRLIKDGAEPKAMKRRTKTHKDTA
jgi:hypothetical protein